MEPFGSRESKQQDTAAEKQDAVDHRFCRVREAARWHADMPRIKQDIEEIRSDRVAERQTAVSFSGCHNRGDELRQGSANGDDGQSDKIWPTPKFVAMMQALSTTRSPPEMTAASPPPIKRILFGSGNTSADLAFLTVAQGGTDHACDVENHSCQKKKTFDAA